MRSILCSPSPRSGFGQAAGSKASMRGLSTAPLCSARSSAMRLKASGRSGATTLIKICGVTSPEDAKIAAEAGADFIGMIMWPKAKRSVSDETARKIADVAKELGATPVGVFVDEDAETISRRCELSGIPVAQLHGDGARSSLNGISSCLGIIYVLHATPEGEIVTLMPGGGAAEAEGSGRLVDWMLVDGLQGGSGQALDWAQLKPPPLHSHAKGWLLAGGLKPENVQQAVRIARPTMVDVSSGVCGPDGLKKDAARVASFIQAVVDAEAAPASRS